MKKLDFIIVGAQKCATTTIHKYLEEHPSVDLPGDKEAPFFNGAHYDEQNFGHFLRKNYVKKGAKMNHLWGKASPQYMSSPVIPARIKAANPDTKIIAVLRNPVRRAFSHYRMAVRRGTENRSFERAIAESLDKGTLCRGRETFAPTHEKGYESESDFYLAWGEYGRILNNYLKEFGAENLMVIFTEDLQANPDQTLEQLLEFIGLEKSWRPQSLGKRFHQGGGKPWIHPGVFRDIANAPGIRNLYNMVSETQKNKLRYWVDQFNVRKTKAVYGLPPHVLYTLNEMYAEDCKRLMALGFIPPWASQFST